MRVAVLVDHFPAVSQTFVLRQITGLMDLGHAVDIYAEWPGDGESVHPEVDRYALSARTSYVNPGMPPATGYWEMPVWPVTGRTWLPERARPTFNAARLLRAAPTFVRCMLAAPRVTLDVLDRDQYGFQAESLSSLYRLRALGSSGRHYDVAHAHFGPVARTFRFVRALWRAPLVVSFHGFDYSRWPRESGPGAYDRLFRCADVVTVNSRFARARVEALGCPPRKLHELPYGVDPDDFAFRARTPARGRAVRLLTVARLVEKKGLEFSIRAVARVIDRHRSLRYDIVGEGPLRDRLERLIADLGIDGIVTLHGDRGGSVVRQMMADADLFVLASVTAADGDEEGTPVSLLEAQACGLPVVATAHAGIPEIVVDGRSAFVVPERDVEALADRLAHLLDHPETWAQMGRHGRQNIEQRFNAVTVNRSLVALYDRAIGAYRDATMSATP